ncbi:ABATE domain-containing protein [Amycolatopsis sp. NPDC051128]|uniref:CGNR zinc finger domain-containing protein n=1 Tax=Amycolatopsis sp. NPDC051128 TaxID=3155412 RepID=UPI00341A4988
MDFIGGLVCLDFANTVGPRRSRPGKEAHDHLGEPADLVAWCEQAGTIGGNRARLLRRRVERHPAAAAETLARAITLREAIHAVFAAIADGEDPPGEALAEVQRAYAEAMAHAALVTTPDGLDWSWAASTGLDSLLWPIARSAAETALTADFGRIRKCPGHEGSCGWLFYDTSKNGQRRWCSMRACGSWEKARRHQQ